MYSCRRLTDYLLSISKHQFSPPADLVYYREPLIKLAAPHRYILIVYVYCLFRGRGAKLDPDTLSSMSYTMTIILL